MNRNPPTLPVKDKLLTMLLHRGLELFLFDEEGGHVDEACDEGDGGADGPVELVGGYDA